MRLYSRCTVSIQLRFHWYILASSEALGPRSLAYPPAQQVQYFLVEDVLANALYQLQECLHAGLQALPLALAAVAHVPHTCQQKQ